MNEILALSGTAQGQLIQDGKISCRELIEWHLDRIDRVEPELNATAEVVRDRARAAALKADRRNAEGDRRSAIDGVPFSVKDSIEVEGCRCTAGTIGFQDAACAERDATLVARLRRAGAIPIARTNLPDLLFSFESDNLIRGRTNNPYHLDRTSGGSSGGEAALIAACASPFGLGSDAVGSVRLPAHFCGIASLKPTSGRLPRTGHVPPAGGWIEMLWQIGPMARKVEDLWTLMPILLGVDGHDHTVVDMPYQSPGKIDVARLRLAVISDNGICSPDSETANLVRRVADALSKRGLVVRECRPPGIEQSYELEMRLLGPDGGDALRHYLAQIGSTRLHPLLEGWLDRLQPYRTDIPGFAACWDELHRFRADLYAFMHDYDAILSPVAASGAVAHGATADESIFRGFSYTMTHNLTGWPAAVVRCGTSGDGLPLGIQIAALPWREDIVLALTQRLEAHFGGWQSKGLVV